MSWLNKMNVCIQQLLQQQESKWELSSRQWGSGDRNRATLSFMTSGRHASHLISGGRQAPGRTPLYWASSLNAWNNVTTDQWQNFRCQQIKGLWSQSGILNCILNFKCIFYFGKWRADIVAFCKDGIEQRGNGGFYYYYYISIFLNVFICTQPRVWMKYPAA